MVDPTRTPQALRAEYVARVNRVIDHIERNLDRPLSLATLADVAHLSRYHFHRIFGAMVGETLNGFVRRLRIERAAVMLASHPGASVTAIALDCGFSSSASFARAFKEVFGTSASEWRERHRNRCDTHRKIRKALGNAGKADGISDCYIDPRSGAPTWRYEMTTDHGKLEAKIEVEERPTYDVAYLRHVGPYGQVALVPRLVAKLREWAIPRELVKGDTRLLLVPHDDPNITEAAKLRLSVCLTVPAGTPVDGEVGTMKIPGGKFAVGHFEIPPARIAEAWSVMYGQWLPQSGFQPDDRICYEEALNDPRHHPEGKILVDICVPVRPL